jgi:RHS repeat-associated protein
MSVYKLQNNTWVWTEQHTSTTLSASLYGADRIGVEKIVVENITTVEVPVYVDCPPAAPGTYSQWPCIAGDMLVTTVHYSYHGVKHYELTNHLGNVMVVVTDQSYAAGLVVLPTVVSATDYFPFGMEMVGRSFSSGAYSFGFNGQYAEKDSETGLLSFDLRALDVRLGRWTSIDPYNQHASPYVSMGNNPVLHNDPDGGRDIYYNSSGEWQKTRNKNLLHDLWYGDRYFWGGKEVDKKRYEGLMDMAWVGINDTQNPTNPNPHSVSANAPMMWQGKPNTVEKVKASIDSYSPTSPETTAGKFAAQALYGVVDGGYITAQKYTTAHGHSTAYHLDGYPATYDEAVGAFLGTASMGLPAVKLAGTSKYGYAYRAVDPNFASATKFGKPFWRSGNPNRLGPDGVYANNAIEGAILEFQNGNPNINPAVFECRYPLSKPLHIDPVPLGPEHGAPYWNQPLPFTQGYNILTAPSLRATGTTNIFIRSGDIVGRRIL